MPPSKLSSVLYWSLPGPRDFMLRVAHQVREARAIAISLTNQEVPGLWDRVEEGLATAHVQRIVRISVSEDTNMESDIGQHFGYPHCTARMLSQQQSGSASAVILRAKDQKSAERCEAFFNQFCKCLPGSTGDVQLFLGVADGITQTDSLSGGDQQVICFNGGLSPSEMHAYVSLRMLGRSGPGSTRLLSSLVCEYSGFDPMLAEQLIALSDGDILRLPTSLTPMLETDPMRWTEESWVNGTAMELGGEIQLHPLREAYIANMEGKRSRQMQLILQQRYWRACIRALTPWLEERRTSVMAALKAPLDQYERTHHGFSRPGRAGASSIAISRDDIEYNHIVGLSAHKLIHIPRDDRSQYALRVCKAAKAVRDELAHLRSPSVVAIEDLIKTMDQFSALSRLMVEGPR